MKYASFMLTPYKYQLVVFVGKDINKGAQAIGECLNDNPTFTEGACGHTWVYSGRPAVLWVETLEDIPVLAHEVVHAVSGVLEHRGLQHTSASEEAYCYLISDVLERILAQRKWERVK